MDKILDYTKVNDFPEGFRYIAEHDIELAKKLIKDMAGLPIYIPKANRTCIIRPYVIERTRELLEQNMNYIQIIRTLVKDTETSDSTIRRLIKELIDEKILPYNIYEKKPPQNQMNFGFNSL